MKIWLIATALVAVTPAIAQHAHHAPATPAAGAQYQGLQNRAIKALSDQQIDDLRAGKGISLALPAELNGYPGPSHTLELAAQLGLSQEQETATKKLFEQMRAETQLLGNELISSEQELDRLFKEKKASPASVLTATADAARAQGLLRAAHLQYHLKMLDVLTADQVASYGRLRGY